MPSIHELLQERGGDELAVHMSSFSKSVAPGLRVGYVVLPERLVPAITALALSLHVSPPLLAQAQLFEFLDAGLLEPNLERVCALLRPRRDALLEVLGDRLPPGAQLTRPDGGYFAWLGDESNSMMSYIDVNWDFSQFDRDNSARHHAGGYALIANRIAADILRDREAARARRDLIAADRALEDAQDALEHHDYGGMLAHAARAYRNVRNGAAKAGVKVRVRQPSTWTVLAQMRDSRMAPSTIDLEPAANRKRHQR